MGSKTILLVDDDPDLRGMLKEYLHGDGYDVVDTGSTAEAESIISDQAIDIIVQDLIMPGDNGIAMIQKVYSQWPIPVIMMSGKAEATDRIIGIEAGADDYIAKPFLPRELSARIQAIFRRTQLLEERARAEISTANESDLICFDCWKMDRGQYQVFDQDGQSAEFTVSEFKVLERLVLANNVVLSRQQLFETIRELDADVFDRAVDIQISRIRKKLRDTARNPKYIKTIRSAGYIFNAEKIQ